MKGRSVGIWMVFLVIVPVLMAYPSFARERAESTGSRRFDPKTVETVKGEVVRVHKVASPGGKGYGVHLTLKTEKETLSIEVGPGWYVEKQPVRIEAKDILEIKGFPGRAPGETDDDRGGDKERGSDPQAAGRERYPRLEWGESRSGELNCD